LTYVVEIPKSLINIITTASSVWVRSNKSAKRYSVYGYTQISAILKITALTASIRDILTLIAIGLLARSSAVADRPSVALNISLSYSRSL